MIGLNYVVNYKIFYTTCTVKDWSIVKWICFIIVKSRQSVHNANIVSVNKVLEDVRNINILNERRIWKKTKQCKNFDRQMKAK